MLSRNSAKRPKWPKKSAYGNRLIKETHEAGLTIKLLCSHSGWSLAQIKRARHGDHVSFIAHEQFLDVINTARRGKKLPPIEIEYPWPVDGPNERENWNAEKVFQSLARMAIYDQSAEHAEEMFKRCRKAKQFLDAAHWADHAAGEYRKQGNLKIASKCLDDCFRAMGKVKKQEKSSVEMRLLMLRARFEQIMVREYMVLGEFPKALKSFQNLDSEADLLAESDAPEKLKGEISLRKIHNKRLQAEMLRLLGHYSAALSLMDEILTENPDWADEVRRRCELNRANSLRLLGDAEKALPIYERLETTAKYRQEDAFLAAVLWPKIGALQELKSIQVRRIRLKLALHDIKALAGDDAAHNRYLFIYSRLVSVPSFIKNAKVANRLVNEAIEAGPLEPECFRTEYAHARLCLAEIARAQKNSKLARAYYSEALHCYKRMEMRWGIVRSTIGLKLINEPSNLPAGLVIEGCDKTLWSRFLRGDDFEGGTLCENIP